MYLNKALKFYKIHMMTINGSWYNWGLRRMWLGSRR